MRNCSHSRNSYPLDKSLLKIHRLTDESDNRKYGRNHDCHLRKYTTAQKKVESDMHHAKQRAYNKKLAKQQLDEMGE